MGKMPYREYEAMSRKRTFKDLKIGSIFYVVTKNGISRYKVFHIENENGKTRVFVSWYTVYDLRSDLSEQTLPNDFGDYKVCIKKDDAIRANLQFMREECKRMEKSLASYKRILEDKEAAYAKNLKKC